MEKEFWTIEEVAATYSIDRDFLDELEREEIICPGCEQGDVTTLSPDEIEKALFARTLVEEMEVNLPGVEVILRMREQMLEMRRQFDQILEDLASQIQRRFYEQ
ncbi:MAG: hypothetical protein COZ11_13135 [Deltaproteobacteria bacterium CG_4_10_14_3_um_filter_51_14]|nr:MAG: hypothetical protein COZ11_13135 [Deltaproteobacteria bacterium CG_4_10_14_3_um_filter_51_14]